MRKGYRDKIVDIVVARDKRLCGSCGEFISKWPVKLILDNEGEFHVIHNTCKWPVAKLWKREKRVLIQRMLRVKKRERCKGYGGRRCGTLHDVKKKWCQRCLKLASAAEAV